VDGTLWCTDGRLHGDSIIGDHIDIGGGTKRRGQSRLTRTGWPDERYGVAARAHCTTVKRYLTASMPHKRVEQTLFQLCRNDPPTGRFEMNVRSVGTHSQRSDVDYLGNEIDSSSPDPGDSLALHAMLAQPDG
jgi:hypothetical protein